jgi:hypothetical protein
MTQQIGYSTAIRTARMNAVLSALDAGTTAAVLTIYGGTRPSTGGSAPTPLVTYPLGAVSGTKPSASVSGGALAILTNGATGVTAANSGTATWGRFTSSAGAFCLDCNVGVSGCDINLSTATIVAGETVTITSGGSFSEGNP